MRRPAASRSRRFERLRPALSVWAGVLFPVLALLTPGAGAAQTHPVEVTVVHVSGSTVYIDAGREAGLREGMEVDVRTAAGPGLRRLVVLGVTADGAGLTFAGAPFPLTRGERLILDVPVLETPGEAPGVGAPDTTAAPVEAAGEGPSAAAPSAVEGLRVAGGMGVELETFQATSSWADQVDPVRTNRLVRPMFRLRGVVTGLPASLTAGTDLRVWQRSTSSTAYEQGTTVRVYRASVSRDDGMVRFRAGRFWAREVPFAAYWDGALMRVGGAVGGGLALGYTPSGGTEGVDPKAPKLAAFMDYENQGRGPWTRGSISYVQERLSWAGVTVRSVAWTQRARWGPASLSNRVEYELGDRALAHADVDLSLQLPRGVRLNAGWLRDRFRPVPLSSDSVGDPRVRERSSVGASWYGALGGLDVRTSRVAGDGEGSSVDGTVWVAPLRPWMPTVSLAASRWSAPERSWLFLSPSLRRRFGPLDVRAAYHHYRIEDALSVRLDGGDVSVSFPVAGVQTRLGVQGEWGAEIRTLRFLSSVWVRF